MASQTTGIHNPRIASLTTQSFNVMDAVLDALEKNDQGKQIDYVTDEKGRLRVWAANLGALQPPESKKSLDFRLRDAPRMHESVRDGLIRLVECGNRVIKIVSGELLNRQASNIGKDNSTTNELEQLLLNINSSIDHMFSLSVLIRRHRPRGRLPTPDSFTPQEISPDIAHVGDKFPKAKERPWLVKRLGNSITQRRQALQYRQSHRKQLAATPDSEMGMGDAVSETVATTFHEQASVLPPPEPPNQQSSSRDRGSVFTSATSFLSSYSEGDIGGRIPDLSDMVLDGVQLDYGTPFECPYCRTIQRAANRIEWKKHVFTDLQPYVCTFADCQSKPFETRNEWAQHEIATHMLRWQCGICGDSAEAVFMNEKDMRDHLMSCHKAMVTSQQIPTLLDAFKRPMTAFEPSSCPLCNALGDSTVSLDAKAYYRHVSRHLQMLSIEALPLFLDDLDIQQHGPESGEELSDSSTISTSSKNRQTREYVHHFTPDIFAGGFGVGGMGYSIHTSEYERTGSTVGVTESSRSSMRSASSLSQAPPPPTGANMTQLKEFFRTNAGASGKDAANPVLPGRERRRDLAVSARAVITTAATRLLLTGTKPRSLSPQGDLLNRMSGGGSNSASKSDAAADSGKTDKTSPSPDSRADGAAATPVKTSNEAARGDKRGGNGSPPGRTDTGGVD